MARQQPDLLVGHLPRKAVAAKQEHVAHLDGERALDVDGHLRMRAHRPRDDVLRDRDLGPCRMLRLHLPGERVVLRQLLDPVTPDPVGPAVAHVADQRAAREQRQHRAGGAHPPEVGGMLAAGVDLGVGLLDARLQRQWRRSRRGLLVQQRHVLRRQGAGHLAGGVGAHAVGHEEQPASPAILLAAPRREHGLGVLVVRPAPADVGQIAVFEARA